MSTEEKPRAQNDRFPLAEARAALARSDDPHYAVLLERGTLELGFYRPDGRDPQQPHDRDEVYIVIAGSGRFSSAGRVRSFAAGDALFVPAGTVHRFTEFSNDFATWVIFYGPPGGEANRRTARNAREPD